LVQEGKEARIQSAAPKIEAGRVYLVRGAWNDVFVSQLTGFPKAAHDEAVDLIGYATEKYFRKKRKGRVSY
jgi:predicted phage terminase large subunit-like protein